MHAVDVRIAEVVGPLSRRHGPRVAVDRQRLAGVRRRTDPASGRRHELDVPWRAAELRRRDRERLALAGRLELDEAGSVA